MAEENDIFVDFVVNNWFENVLWPTYPRELCNKIGPKSTALTAAIKKVTSQEIADVVMAGLREQMRYNRKLKNTNNHESQWKLGMCVTWLNQERWTDEIPSHYELQKSQEKVLCACGAVAKVGQLCMTCYEKTTPQDDWRLQKMREYYIRNNLGRKHDETKDDWILRLRGIAKREARRIGK